MTTKVNIEELEKYASLPKITNDEIADCLGISRRSFYNHKKNNAEFARALQTGPSKGRAKRILRMDKASDAGDWRAADRLLCMDDPERFVVPKHIEHSGRGGGPIQAVDWAVTPVIPVGEVKNNEPDG